MIDSYIDEKYYKSAITAQIIKCAQNIQHELGAGFQELIYQRACVIEFTNSGLRFEREKEIPVYYKGRQIGTRRADFVIDEDIILEIKAISALEAVHQAQTMNYIEAYKMRIGLLVNFGAKQLEVRRFIK